MQTSHRLAFAFVALALGAPAAGCSSADPSRPGGGSGGDDDGGDGGGSGAPSPRPLDPTGTYTMHSTFDIAANMPGTAGTVLRTITADPGDPTKWILDQLIAQLPQSWQSLAGLIVDLAAPSVNDYVLRNAGDFANRMVQIADGVGTIATQFELDESFAITGAAGSYTATHTVVGVHYHLDNGEGDVTLASYGVPNIVVDHVPVTMDASGQLTIAAHNLPIAYGQLIRVGVDGALIPLIDASAHSLNDLLAHTIDCTALGGVIADAVDIPGFGASLITAACKAGLNAAANAAYNAIQGLNSNALAFAINGSARAVDRNSDRTIDEIDSGTWVGMLSYGSTPTQLAPAVFTAAKQ